MLFEHQGECPFCHAQLILTSTIAKPSAEELSEEAAEFCTCEGAKLDRGMKATEKKLNTVIGGDSIGRGFNYAVSDETFAAVRGICEMILLDLIVGAVTLNIPGGDKLRLIKDKNCVKIRRDTKRQLEI